MVLEETKTLVLITWDISGEPRQFYLLSGQEEKTSTLEDISH